MFAALDTTTIIAASVIAIALVSIVVWYVYSTRKRVEPKPVASVAAPLQSSGPLVLPVETERNINVEQTVDARTLNCPRCEEKTVISSTGAGKIRFCMKCKGYYDCPGCEVAADEIPLPPGGSELSIGMSSGEIII